MTLIRISSCLSHCEWVFVRTFTGGEPWVNLSLSFCSPFSLFPSFTPPRSEKPQCNCVCPWLCFPQEYFWVQWTMLLFFSIAAWFRWPGVNGSTRLLISKGDGEGLDTSLIWQHCLKACWWRKHKHRSTGAKVTPERWSYSMYIFLSLCSGLSVPGVWSW